jgi:hypothetical protein
MGLYRSRRPPNPCVVTPIDPEPCLSPSRPRPDQPPRVMVDRGDHQAALSRMPFPGRPLARANGPSGAMIAYALTVEPKSPRSRPGPEGDACPDLGADGPRAVGVHNAAGAPAEICDLSTNARFLTTSLRRAQDRLCAPNRLRSLASAAGRLGAPRLIRSVARPRLIMARGNGPYHLRRRRQGDRRKERRAELRHPAGSRFRFRRYRPRRADA